MSLTSVGRFVWHPDDTKSGPPLRVDRHPQDTESGPPPQVDFRTIRSAVLVDFCFINNVGKNRCPAPSGHKKSSPHLGSRFAWHPRNTKSNPHLGARFAWHPKAQKVVPHLMAFHRKLVLFDLFGFARKSIENHKLSSVLTAWRAYTSSLTA